MRVTGPISAACRSRRVGFPCPHPSRSDLIFRRLTWSAVLRHSAGPVLARVGHDDLAQRGTSLVEWACLVTVSGDPGKCNRGEPCPLLAATLSGGGLSRRSRPSRQCRTVRTYDSSSGFDHPSRPHSHKERAPPAILRNHPNNDLKAADSIFEEPTRTFSITYPSPFLPRKQRLPNALPETRRGRSPKVCR